jgi:cytochrome c peroxidase
MEQKVLVFLLIVVTSFSCTKDFTSENEELDTELKRLISRSSPSGDYTYYKVPNGDDLSAFPQDPKNQLTPQKVELGKLLFHETGFAIDAAYSNGMGTYSCASCHIAEAGFRAGAPQGVADGGKGFGINGENRLRTGNYQEEEIDVQSARPMSLVNVAFVTNTFWNGQFGAENVNIGTEDVWELREDTEVNLLGFEAIEAQNFIGIQVHRINVTEALINQYGYQDLFDESFPEMTAEERYTQRTASLALSAYIRSINSYEAPFQEWIRGNYAAMSEREKRGAILFFGKARCTNCHYEKNLGSVEFHALGVKDMYQRPSFNTSPDDRRNLGRGGFTLNDEDNFKFRVPQLYNLDDSPFYFHGASKMTLEEVIDYKIAAQTENPNVSQGLLSSKFNPLDLSEQEREDLIMFVRRSLHDPNLERFKPEYIFSGNCFPNNDPQSQIDLGCR